MNTKRTGDIMRGNERGAILPMVLVMTALGLLLLVPTLNHGVTSLNADEVMEDRARELYAADSGIEEGILWLINGHPNDANWTWDEDADPPGTRELYDLNGATVTVTIRKLATGEYYNIRAEAVGPNGATTVISRVWAAPGATEGIPGGTYEGDVYVDGDGDMQAHDQIIGDVTVSGDFTMKAQSGVDGDVSVQGDYTQNSHTTVTGNLCASGESITMKAQSTLQGDIYLELEDGNNAVIEFQGQAEAGDIYVAVVGTDATASVTIALNNKDVVGDIYVMSSVTLIRDFKKGSTHGDIDENWDPAEVPPPECPGIDVGGGVILTYEIM